MTRFTRSMATGLAFLLVLCAAMSALPTIGVGHPTPPFTHEAVIDVIMAIGAAFFAGVLFHIGRDAS